MKLQEIVSFRGLCENYQEFVNILDFKANFIFNCVFPLNPNCSLTIENRVTDNLEHVVKKVYMLSEPLLTHPEFENQVKDYNVQYMEVPFSVTFTYPFKSLPSIVLINLFVRIPKVKRDNYVMENEKHDQANKLFCKDTSQTMKFYESEYLNGDNKIESFSYAEDKIDLEKFMEALYTSPPGFENLGLWKFVDEEMLASDKETPPYTGINWDPTDLW